ncbi:DNA phosphorothioation-dependent restriction protein DptH [Ferrimonas balearica]|uniref:DNA phosphorothioation-dependent restriction protein DptH n=1 Tax=Ferrimonas balearica TaxID=44012 RepID=UPI001C942E43|nr:DNA phosphorothioation-dependent restriction protein DptH [Ferrimonas balearica]MBY5980536.1 DNA phosphorothioation-dependent restriction protein DptH [Ferrimonas balearica]
MSVEQFEDYLVKKFAEWSSKEIKPGVRYQFKSPDSDNSKALYQAFLRATESKYIADGDVKLPYLTCGQVQLIPVLHRVDEKDQEGFSENYISHLRDSVAGKSGAFKNAALLVIHNSMLDTLINSALNVSDKGAIWNPRVFERELEGLVDQLSNTRELSLCLLKDQLAVITDDQSTIFGFRALYRSLLDGELHFDELGLFHDPVILTMRGQDRQIRKRLDENRKLRESIDFNVEHYPEQLDVVMTDFSSKFIKTHFEGEKDWKALPYQAYRDEIKTNRAQSLVLEEVTAEGASVIQRAKADTKVGQREQSLLIQATEDHGQVTLELVFDGNDLTDQQVRLTHNKELASAASIKLNHSGGKRSRVAVTLPFSGQPTYFSIELKRENRSEEYKFRCLIVRESQFLLGEIKNCFRVEPRKQWVTLQLDENTLRIGEASSDICSLGIDDNTVDAREYGFVDFEVLANESEFIQFSVQTAGEVLNFNVEGRPAEKGVSTPLLLNQNRFNRLLRDDCNAEFNQAKKRIIVDNRESAVGGAKLQFLNWELEFAAEGKLHWSGERSLSNAELSGAYPALASAYSALLQYYQQHNTLPSLVAWGDGYCSLVQAVLDEFEDMLPNEATNSPLTQEQKQLMRIGTVTFEGTEYIAAWHPLVLAYHLKLARALADEKEAGESTFQTLPKVTLERLVASGLMPYVYHAESEFAHVVPSKDNSFWLELIPHKEANFGYVQRLVRDKLAEFTKAYARLFAAGSASALTINAINQLDAKELFLGVIDHFKKHLDDSPAIHVNFYDDKLHPNQFDWFAETGSLEELKGKMGLDSNSLKGESDLIIDLIRSRLSYSKFVTPSDDTPLAYAHLAFFKNNARVDCRQINIDDALSGVLCDGLIAGEAAETKSDSYYTSFGLRQVDVDQHQPLRLARTLGNLWQPARQSNQQYLGHGLGLAVSSDFKALLNRSYDSALWTTVIDPKVTLDFFTSQKDVVLIHYSDQYTSSAGYDAITVTKEVDLFKRLLQKESQSGANNLLSEFNAFNGEWLLNMLTSGDKDRKEKHGIIGAYKFVSTMLKDSDICWVPLSVAEMLRVSGNVGLKMSDSEFSRHVQGYKKGAISDDVLFVGFKGETLYLLPLEVKAGVRPDFVHAGKQAKELLRYLKEDVLGPDTFAARLYRALFIRQVLMQVEKLRLYGVLAEGSLAPLMDKREWWLKGDFDVDAVPDYYDGIVLAHLSNDSCIDADFELTPNNILKIELPYAWLMSLVDRKADEFPCNIPEEHRLKRSSETIATDLEKGQLKKIGGEQTFNFEENMDFASLRQSTSPVALTTKEASSNGCRRVLLGKCARTEKNVYWEYDHPELANRHMIIFGRSGQGKTYCIQGLLMDLARQKASSLVIDYTNGFLPGHLEPEFIEAVEPKSHILAQQPIGIRPFRKQSQDFGGVVIEEATHTVAGRISSVFNKVYSSIGERQLATLANVIEEGVALHGENYDFNCMLEALKDEGNIGEALANKLSPLVKSNLFGGETKHSWSDVFASGCSGSDIIQMASLPNDTSMLGTEFILWDLYAYACSYGNKKNPMPIVLDEVQNLDHRLESPLGKMLTEGRKFGISLILATQTLSMLAKDQQDRLFQASHKLFFAPAETEVEKYAKLLELSIPNSNKKEWVERLNQLKKGECISVGLHMNNSGTVSQSARRVKVSALGDRI